jgi:hypothetical protein
LSVHNHIRVRFDAVLTAGPRPGRVPAKDGAADLVKRGALAARCSGALAPEVVVEGVSAGLDEIPVWMEY